MGNESALGNYGGIMIEDEELRQTFREASDEALENIEAGLQHLETYPDDRDRLEEILQHAHTLKGSAGMLDLKDLRTLAAQWETTLEQAIAGNIPLDNVIDRLTRSLDPIRKLVREAITGEPSGVNAFYALADLMGATRPRSEESPNNNYDSTQEEEREAEEEPEAIAIENSPPQIQMSAPSGISPHYIDDDELRDTFRIAGEEHLQKLDEGLLHLESYPNDDAKLEEVLREIHSIKGDSGMLGVSALVPLAHEWEQQLIPVKEGEIEFTEELSDRLYNGLNAIRAVINEAITGDNTGVDIEGAIAALKTGEISTETSENQRDREISATSFEPSEGVNPVVYLTPTPSGTSPHYIDDDELRDTFRIAGEEHLQKLDEGLLHLENYPNDAAKLEEVLREIHSIKGDSGMLGVSALVPLAHEWEQQLIPVKEGEIEFSEELSDRLYNGLNAIRAVINEAITGDNTGVDIEGAIAALKTGETPARSTSQPPSPPPKPPQKPQESKPQKIQSKSELPQPPTLKHPNSNNTYRIETIRVETRNLDALMTQAGELTVAKIRIAHRLSEIEEIVALWEDWSRDAFMHRFSDRELARYNGNGAGEKLQSVDRRFEERLERLGTLVNSLRNSLSEDTARLETVSDELEDGIRTLRLLPLSTIFNLYPRLVRDIAKHQGKEVDFSVTGGDTRADKRIIEEMKDPLTHILRNAIDHGIETPEERQRAGKPRRAKVEIVAYQSADRVIIEIRDDGRGLNTEKIKETALKRGICRPEDLVGMSRSQIHNLIFVPGFSTRSFVTELSGRGVGLDVVKTNVERLKGTIDIESEPQKGCTIRLHLGTTLATAHVLLVETNGQPYALPVEYVETARLVDPNEIFSIEGRETILVGDRPVSAVRLAALLELPADSTSTSGQLPCIVLKVGEERLGVLVDALIDEQDVILKPQSKLLQRVPNVAGATILGTGEVCTVLSPQDLLASVRQTGVTVAAVPKVTEKTRSQVLLLVEDSIATRTQEKRILESAGYEVVTAVDGLDGWNKLKTREFDAIISDIQMPNLDGLGLTQRIRSQPQYAELPIVLVTSLATEDDRRRGAEAGANAYITKNSFDREMLVETLRRLV